MAEKTEREKREEARRSEHRQIMPSVTGETRLLYEWLFEQFKISDKEGEEVGKPKATPDIFPEKISLHAVFGEGMDLSPAIAEPTWKPQVASKPTREELAALANDLFAKAQRWTMVNGRKQQRFCAFAFNNARGAQAYSHHPFVATAAPREYTDSTVPASDSYDTHRDRLLDTALIDKRFTMSQALEALNGAVKLAMDQNAMLMQQLRDKQQVLQQYETDRRSWIQMVEDLKNQENERRIKYERAALVNEIATDAWANVKGYLPGVVAHISKGKVGIKEGVNQFVNGLTYEQKVQVFGLWEEGDQKTQGILRREQIDLLIKVADGLIDPLRILDLKSDLDGDQIVKLQSVLKQGQIGSIFALMSAAEAAEKKVEEAS